MRTDEFLCKKGFFDSRTKAKQAIERGEVFINGKKILKPAAIICSEEHVEVERKCEEAYVSLGGFKLAKALKDFSLSVNGICAADIGASTGGFTDCLLKNGARKVFAIDLNDELLHQRLKEDSRVVPIIKNAKYLTAEDFSESPKLIVADLSFISATLILPVIYRLLSDGDNVVILIKPQFENDSRKRFKNGIVRDKKVRLTAVKKVFDCAVAVGFLPKKITEAPLYKDKNTEYLILMEKGESAEISFEGFV